MCIFFLSVCLNQINGNFSLDLFFLSESLKKSQSGYYLLMWTQFLAFVPLGNSKTVESNHLMRIEGVALVL